jgi:hypothetical protein
MRRKLLCLGITLALVLAALPLLATPVQAATISTRNYGDVTLTGEFLAGNFPEIWDLTTGPLVLSCTVNLNGIMDNDPNLSDWACGDHAWSEFGVRTLGKANFNPNLWGVWLATDYDEAWPITPQNTFAPDPTGAPTLDMDDKLILQKQSGQGEGAYNLPSTPPAPGNNHRVWWDRDGVDAYQNPATANTLGIYQIIISLHATSATEGTAYMNIRGLDQGFETDGNWNTIELTPAGMTFIGDMANMQVFYGLYGYGAVHSVSFNSINATGYLKTYTIDASVAGGNGSVAPATQTVNYGDNASIDITPDLGYHIASITDNLISMPIANPYVISNVTEDHAVVVTFAIATSGKATGGVKFMVDGVEVQLEFDAIATADGVKGNVKYSNSSGETFFGKVDGYYQEDNIAVIVGTIVKGTDTGYFYVVVQDNGEGKAAKPDAVLRVLTGSTPYILGLDGAIGYYPITKGNIQIHKSN